MPERTPASHTAWYAMSASETLSRLKSTPHGLDDSEAERRLTEHGPNQLRREQSRPWWRRLFAQLNNLLIVILILAAIASLGLGHLLDAAAIFGVVTIIALIGFLQEGKAEQALESIRDMLSPQANVIRDGRRQVIPAERLVPGDIVIVESGDGVPADLQLLEAHRFYTDSTGGARKMS